MILDNKTTLIDQLSRQDHVHIINNYQQTTTSSYNSPIISSLLADYRGTTHLQCIVSPNGKPELCTTPGQEPLFFSISHSANVATLLVSKTGAVGIDIEAILPRPHANAIAKRYFALKTPCNLFDFYRHWTAREAYIKAMGGRLFRDMAGITVRAGSEFGIGHQYITHNVSFFEPRPGFIGALCRPKNSQKVIKVINQLD